MKRKILLLMLPGILTLAGWLALPSQSAYGLRLCFQDGRTCFNDGETFICQYSGCCGRVLTGSCTCAGGFWSCPEKPERPPGGC